MAVDQQETTGEATEVGKCSGCNADLPLRDPLGNEEVSQWICTQCGATIGALFNQDANEQLRSNVRPAAVNFDDARMQQPSEAIADFLSHLEAQQDPTEERRSSERRTLSQAVAVMPVDDQFRPAGDCFMAVARDVSRQGIAIVHTNSVEADYLALELACASGKKLQVAMQVARRREVGDYYECAGPFLTKMGTN